MTEKLGKIRRSEDVRVMHLSPVGSLVKKVRRGREEGALTFLTNSAGEA
jgi:hypothetical protein